MTLDRSLKTTFDDIPRLYHEARPRYPEALVEDVVALSGIPPGGRILEIGCGPGTATLPFARRGYTMVCLELGANLVALAAEQVQTYPRVRVENVAFEDWPLQARAFDVVMSATAFHWIPAAVGYPKAAAALKAGGALVLFWYHSPTSDAPFYRAAHALWQEKAPGFIERHTDKSADELVEMTMADIGAAGLFGAVSVRRYEWAQRYTAAEYVRLLSTYSPVRRLDAQVRQEALASIAALVEEHGGTVERPYTALLYVAQVR